MAKIKQALDDYKPDSRLVDERGATPERQRRGDAPITVALNKKQITPQQYAAAQKFYAHWFHGGRAGTVHSKDLTNVFVSFNPSTPLTGSEWFEFHRKSFMNGINMLRDMRNPKYLYVVPRVVLWEEPIERVTDGLRSVINIQWNNRPQASVVTILALQDGLDRLGREWGLI